MKLKQVIVKNNGHDNDQLNAELTNIGVILSEVILSPAPCQFIIRVHYCHPPFHNCKRYLICRDCFARMCAG